MNTTFLTREEVKELTATHWKKRQIDILRAQRIPFFINAAGWPVVTRAAIQGGWTTESRTVGWTPPVFKL
jgi:Domain of unknown function (DUF4224)